MTHTIVEEVRSHSPAFETALTEIQTEIEAGMSTLNIETLLSSIEAKRAVIGRGILNGLDASGFSDLSKLIKERVVKIVSVHESLQTEELRKLAHSRLTNWIQKARRRYPAEIFTTNYDYLFEMALERSGVPYFDGFSGSFEPFFCPEAVEDVEAYPHLVKLWKMHGSLGWTYRESDKAVIRHKSAAADSILIYPSHLKYNTSKKQPYVGLIDRLCAFLQQDDAVLITCGYSFGDNHINERIVTSLRRGANSHVIAMFYDQINYSSNESVFGLANEANSIRRMATHETGGKMSVYGLRHAVIGGRFGEWRLRDRPKSAEAASVGLYFLEDAVEIATDGKTAKFEEPWAGTGRFLLPDFRKLTEFLNDLSSSDGPTTAM
jgi:hypothetical protein